MVQNLFFIQSFISVFIELKSPLVENNYFQQK